MSLKISPAEWEVLNTLWDKSPATVPEVWESLAANRQWHIKTVGTFLSRLEEKGIVSVRREGKVNFYSPLVSREQCAAQESETFLHRVFRGATAPMLAHFCETADLSDDEIAELQRLLEKRVSQRQSSTSKQPPTP